MCSVKFLYLTEVIKVDIIFERTLLYDFYGELLTEKQKQAYELHFLEDLSLGEIAEVMDISRQAVHDNLKKSDKQLHKYEEKLKLVDKFVRNKQYVNQIFEMATVSYEDDSQLRKRIDEIKTISANMLSEL